MELTNKARDSGVFVSVIQVQASCQRPCLRGSEIQRATKHRKGNGTRTNTEDIDTHDESKFKETTLQAKQKTKQVSGQRAFNNSAKNQD